MTTPILQATDIVKRYGKFTAVGGVSLSILPGTVHSVIGPNGAGKTTLFHVLTGTVPITAGSIRIGGEEIAHLPDYQRVGKGLARSFQVTSLFPNLSVRENLRLAAQGRTPREALRFWRTADSLAPAGVKADALLARLHLQAVAERPTGELSHGQQRRLEIGMALGADPKVMFLDEPTSGMGSWHFGRINPRRFVVVCLATTVGNYVTTLPGWADPLGFAVSSVLYMTHHAWGGCTLTNGACIGTHTVEWSAWQYALTWLWAQLPLTVLIGIVPALGAALVRGSGRRILAVSLIWPMAAIGMENSTLYDGLRHLLFALPLAFALVVLLADQLINRWAWLRAPFSIVAIGMLSLAIVDDIRLFPFNYSYFNLVTRQWADETWFETDYWGFSLKQAVEIALPLTANDVGVAAMPSFLATPFLPSGVPVVDLDKQGEPTSFQQSYVLIYITRLQKRARSTKCKEVGNVSRSLALTKVNMKLAVIDVCNSWQQRQGRDAGARRMFHE